ncbi:SDR family oxidoreductase [Magnetospirillum sp. UT-4]|uniref:SDR family oxidoreductase n=1 Tax=Magnetospirillum sp. UT-4 TaxID=2681467 RepID=UPI001384A037|nr:SDR family oxidoreductase [Magnetospirillum sp. UT-4]CAA7617915.1 L-allo-threonine dehydrogenase, NAD(P)-binding [Magnetospirillum sp. UT-4]
MSPWSDRTVFITGATAGFGEAMARRYAELGARLVLCGRRRDRLDGLAAELHGCRLATVVLDVRDRKAVDAAIAALPPDFAAIDVLINNAGLALGLEPAHQTDLDDWERMVDTNLKGLMYVTRAVLPGMVARDRGHVVNISSIAGTYPYPGGNAYGATKAAVTQFSLNLIADLVRTRIRVTNIEPGLCGGSEFSLVRFKGDAEAAAKVYAGTTPLTSEDVAEAVVWATCLPAHVNINRIEMMPVSQGPAGLTVYREG